MRIASAFAALVVLVAACSLTAREDPKKDIPKKADRDPDCVWVGSPPEVVEKMLEVAKPTEKDTLYDLGCGDGRILIAAAKKYACKAEGCDIDPERVRESLAAVGKLDKDVRDRISVSKADLFEVDFSGATVVTLFLLPKMNAKLIDKFAKLAAGSRIVSHCFAIPGAVPDEGYPIVVKTKDALECDVYLYTTPLKFAKDKQPQKKD